MASVVTVKKTFFCVEQEEGSPCARKLSLDGVATWPVFRLVRGLADDETDASDGFEDAWAVEEASSSDEDAPASPMAAALCAEKTCDPFTLRSDWRGAAVGDAASDAVGDAGSDTVVQTVVDDLGCDALSDAAAGVLERMLALTRARDAVREPPSEMVWPPSASADRTATGTADIDVAAYGGHAARQARWCDIPLPLDAPPLADAFAPRTLQLSSVLGSPSFLTPPEITAPAPVSQQSMWSALPATLADHASLEARAQAAAADAAVHAATPGRLSERRQPARPRRNSAQAAASRTVAMSGETRTTVMMRNLPNDYTRQMMLDLLASRGFAGHYDFFYLPMDFTTGSNIGYAFINLSCPSSATAFWEAFDGFSRWSLRSRKVCNLCWSDPCQGLDANVKRYQNSPVMCDTVPEEFKPMIFSSAGKQMRFPAPTRALRPPRMARA